MRRALYVPVVFSYLGYTGPVSTVDLILPVVVTPHEAPGILKTDWSSVSSALNGGQQGDLTDTLNVVVTNPNPYVIHGLSGVLSYSQSEMTNVTGGTESFSTTPLSVTVPSMQEAVLSFTVNISPNATIGPNTVSLALGYLDQWNLALSQTYSLSVYIYGKEAPALVQLTNTVPVGAASTVSFMVSNSGTSPMYDVRFNLTIRSPLVLVSNTTYSGVTTIPAGGQVLVSAQVVAGSSVSPGAYSGVLEVLYNNAFGLARTDTYAVGFLVTGTIHFVILSESMAQASKNVTVTGVLLNEGTTSALYTLVTANLTASSAPLGNGSTYVGLVNPSTPVPFTVVVPSSPPQQQESGVVSLQIGFQNANRQVQTASFSYPVALLPASSIPQPGQSGESGDLLILGGVVAAIVIIAFAYVYLRGRPPWKGSGGNAALRSASAPDDA